MNEFPCAFDSADRKFDALESLRVFRVLLFIRRVYPFSLLGVLAAAVLMTAPISRTAVFVLIYAVQRDLQLLCCLPGYSAFILERKLADMEADGATAVVELADELVVPFSVVTDLAAWGSDEAWKAVEGITLYPR